MEEKHARCAGMDVHRKQIVVCVRLVEGKQVKREVRRFGTTTSELCKVADWLEEAGCTHAVMESTGVYWKPVWHILEGHVELVLANAQHVRNMPGRKSDMNDATWLAELMAHGLVQGSFVPPEQIRELRDQTRTRAQLVGEVRRHLQRIHSVLLDANIQITGRISDMLGRTGRAVLDALVAGQTDPEHLAGLCQRIKTPRAELVEALRGHVTKHHRRILALHLRLIDSLRAEITELEAQIEEQLRPFQEDCERLHTLPGVSFVLAAVLLAEIGPDMHRFPTAGHLVSWAGLCPGLNETGGRNRSSKLRKGAPWLKAVLLQAAWAAARALVFGLSHEICGEQGLGWSRRLQLVHAGLHGQGGFPERAAKYIGKKYGYSAEAGTVAGERVRQLLGMLAARLKVQRATGSRHYVGGALSAVDIYAATFLALLRPLPHEVCAMDPVTRAAFELRDPETDAALEPVLLEHREMMYREHLVLPLAL